MSKILILSKSGFGKSTSIGKSEKLGIEGLDPKETFVISAVNKPLPFKGSSKLYTKFEKPGVGNRLITDDAKTIATMITALCNAPYKNIVLDDMNYISQNYYMRNALKGGWDCPKAIGYNMGLIFDAIDKMPDTKNIICMAHYEEYKDKNGDSISYKYKTTGNMVDAYITPEGKFEIVLFGKVYVDENTKKVEHVLVTNNDGEYPAKSPVGMLPDIYMPNDLGVIVKKIEEYYN